MWSEDSSWWRLKIWKGKRVGALQLVGGRAGCSGAAGAGQRAQGTSLDIPSLDHPQHGAVTIMVQELSSSSAFVDVGWELTTPTQQKPLPCFPLQLGEPPAPQL